MKRVMALFLALAFMAAPIYAANKTEEKVHFIDVGQADCTLVESNGSYMLIDGGEEDDAETIKQYLRDNGVDTLTYIIATHPHADHIGSLDDVINSVPTKNVIMPRVSASTYCFENMARAIAGSKAAVIEPIVGSTYSLGDFKFTIIGPKRYAADNHNNNSVAIKLVNGSDRFVFTGDAEIEEETDIVDSGIDISADVLKIGHHGSRNSTSTAFLEKVAPKYAVISVGKDNSYGHPSDTIIDKLNSKKIQIYRTDTNGTVTAVSTGKGITFTMGGSARQDKEIGGADQKAAETYILNKHSMKFHKTTCIYGKKTSPANKVIYTGYSNTLVSLGYSPCKVCQP